MMSHYALLESYLLVTCKSKVQKSLSQIVVFNIEYNELNSSRVGISGTTAKSRISERKFVPLSHTGLSR